MIDQLADVGMVVGVLALVALAGIAIWQLIALWRDVGRM